MTSPLRIQNENSMTDSFAVKEAQWHTEREKLVNEIEAARVSHLFDSPAQHNGPTASPYES